MIIKIQDRRKKLNIKQLSISSDTGIGRTTISEIERGIHIPSVITALKIAKALRCTVEDLFCLEEGD